jgi:hypothetical protein
VDVSKSNPREGRSRGFNPIVQSESDTLSCAGGGGPGDVGAMASAVRRVDLVREFEGEVRRMFSFSSHGLNTKYSRLRLNKPRRLIT